MCNLLRPGYDQFTVHNRLFKPKLPDGFAQLCNCSGTMCNTSTACAMLGAAAEQKYKNQGEPQQGSSSMENLFGRTTTDMSPQEATKEDEPSKERRSTVALSAMLSMPALFGSSPAQFVYESADLASPDGRKHPTVERCKAARRHGRRAGAPSNGLTTSPSWVRSRWMWA